MMRRYLIVSMLSAFVVRGILGIGVALALDLENQGERLVLEAFDTNGEDWASRSNHATHFYGATIDSEGFSGASLRLSSETFATIETISPITTHTGTIAFWVKPHASSASTQTYIAMKWAGQPASYLAISQGWWEPLGQDRLYFILSNTRYIHCSVKYTLPRDKWSQIVATWSSGQSGYCTLYVNGEPLARHRAPFTGDQHSGGPIYLGSDAPATNARGRGADAHIDELIMLPRAVSNVEVAQSYAEAKSRHSLQQEVAGPWIEEVLSHLAQNNAEEPEALVAETRAMFHEGIEWALSEKSADEIISRISASGFNVYIPCIWYATGARFPSSVVPIDPRLSQRISQEDPFAYLIEIAHEAGIEVHACIAVARRGSRPLFPQFASAGAPNDAYDLHDPRFRKTIVDMVTEVLRRYPIDGLNLDYIRTMGICTSVSCAADYRKRMGRSLHEDVSAEKSDVVAAKSLADWNFVAVTEIVRDVSAAVQKIRPGTVISVDAHPNNPDLMRQGQDVVRWANEGIVDVIFDMEYGRIIDVENIDKVRQMLDEPSRLAIMLATYDRDGTNSTARPSTLLEKYIQLVRHRWPGMGLGIYNYPLWDEQAAAFSSKIFMPRLPPSCPVDWGQLCFLNGRVKPGDGVVLE